MAAGQGRGEGRRARHDAALARRGPARRHRAARAVHPGVDGEAARRARRAGHGARQARRYGAHPGGQPVEKLAAAVPEAASDRQPHPPARRPGGRGRVGAGRAGRSGSRASSRSAPTRQSLRGGAGGAEAHEDVFCAVGPPPELARPATRRDRRELRELARAPERARDRRDRAGRLPRLRAARRPGARVRATRSTLAREVGKPLVIHTRAAEDDTIATLARRRRGARGHPALLLDAGPARRVPRPRLVDLVRRQRHLPEGGRPGRRGGARPARPPAGRDRRALPDAAGRAQGAQPAGVRRPHRALHRRAPRDRLRASSRRRSRRTLPSCSAGERAPGAAEPAPHARVRHPAEPRPGPELPRRLEHPRRHRPAAELDARGRRARGRRRARRAVASTSPSASRTCTSSSSTARLEPPLRDALDAARRTPRCISPTRSSSTSLRWTPRPPRSSRTSLRRGRDRDLCARSRARRASTAGWRWCRRRSVSGSPPGRRRPRTASRRCSPSSRATCKVLRTISRNVFFPVPNVDSVLVGLERRGPAPPPELRALVQQGFAHRRKALARSALAGAGRRSCATAPARRWRRSASPPTRAPRRSRPTEWRALYEQAAHDRARARQGQPLRCSSARRAPDGLHPLVSVVQPVTLADELTHGARPRRRRGRLPRGRRREPRAAALAAFRAATGWDGPPLRIDDHQAHPGRGGHGGRVGRRRGGAALRLASPAARRRAACTTRGRPRRRRPEPAARPSGR